MPAIRYNSLNWNGWNKNKFEDNREMRFWHRVCIIAFQVSLVVNNRVIKKSGRLKIIFSRLLFCGIASRLQDKSALCLIVYFCLR